MVDRRWVRDLSLAILLTLPLAAFARQPQIPKPIVASASASFAAADRLSPANGRISLLG
jgi:hypothetical protein